MRFDTTPDDFDIHLSDSGAGDLCVYVSEEFLTIAQ